jgi:tetratricopeptide (TPR) repeat protein
MAKQLNKNIVLGLTLVGMLAMLVVGALLVINLPEKDPTYYVAQAKAASEAREHLKAAKLYGRAWSVSTNPQYLVDAGQQALEGGDADQAMRAWRQAIVAAPKFEPAQKRVTEFFLEYAKAAGAGLGRWERLKEEAEKLLAINENSSLGYYTLGLSQLGLDELDESNAKKGEENLQRALELAPDNSEYGASLAEHYERANKFSEAEALFAKLLEAAPDDARAHRSYGLYLMRRAAAKEREAAAARGEAARAKLQDEGATLAKQSLAELQKGVEAAPKDVENYVALGNYWIVRGATAAREAARATGTRPTGLGEECFQKAEAALAKAVEVEPNGYRSYLALGRLYALQGQPKDAAAIYEQRLNRTMVSDTHMRWLDRLYKLQILKQAFDTALARLGDASGTAREDLLKQAEGYYRRAVAEARGGEKDPAAMVMEGRLKAVQNEYREAIAVLEAAQKRAQVADPEILFYLADLYNRVGETGAAEEALRTIVGTYQTNVSAWSMLAVVCNRNNHTAAALQAAERALALDPTNANALRAMRDAYRTMNNWDKVKEIQDRLAATEGEAHLQGVLERAVLARAQARDAESGGAELLKEAEEDLRYILEKDPLHVAALRQYVEILREAGRDDEAQAMLNRAEKLASAPEHADDAALRWNLQLLRVLADPKKTDEERVEATAAMIAKGEYPDEFLREVDYLQVYLRAGKTEQAMAHAKKAVKLKPNSAGIADVVFRLAIQVQDDATAKSMMALASEHDLDGVGGHLFAGRYYLSKKDPERAITEFRAALERSDTQSLCHALLGRALMVTGHLDQAEESFARAVEINPNMSIAHVGLAQLAEMRGDTEGMAQHLEVAKRLIPEHPWVAQKIAEEEEAKNPEEAIARREQERAKLPKDPSQLTPQQIGGLVRLAGLYAQVGRTDDADGVWQQILSLTKKMPELRHRMLVWSYTDFLRRKSPPEPARALATLQEFLSSRESDVAKSNAQLLIAQHLLECRRLGLPDAPTPEAIDAAYEKALQLAETNMTLTVVGRFYAATGRREQAETLYRKAVEQAMQARASAESESEKETARADEAGARRQLLSLLVGSRNVERRDEIDGLIAEYLSRFPDDSAGLYFRAEHCLATGRDDAAEKDFTAIIAQNPRNALAYFRRGIINYRKWKWDAAIDDLNNAKLISPSGFQYRHRTLLASAYLQAEREADAISELQSILAEDPDAGWVAQELISTYVNTGQLIAAEELALRYSQRFPEDPQWPLTLARLAENPKRETKDAGRIIQWYRQAATLSRYSPEAVVMALQAMGRYNRLDELIDFVVRELPTVDGKRAPIYTAYLATARYQKGDRKQAMADFDTALEAARGSLPMFLNVVRRMQLMLGDAETEKAVQSRLGSDGQAADALYAMAHLHRARAAKAKQAGDTAAYKAELDKTEQLLQQAMEAAKDDASKSTVLRFLAQTQYEHEKFQESRASYIELLKMQPDNAFALNNLAYMLMTDLKRPQEALKYSEQVVAMSDTPMVLDTYGWNLALLKRYTDALGPLSHAVQGNPDEPLLLLHRASVYKNLSETRTDADARASDLQQATEDAKRAVEVALASGKTDALDEFQSLLDELQVPVDRSKLTAAP